MKECGLCSVQTILYWKSVFLTSVIQTHVQMPSSLLALIWALYYFKIAQQRPANCFAFLIFFISVTSSCIQDIHKVKALCIQYTQYCMHKAFTVSLSPLLQTAADASVLAEVRDCERSHDGSWDQFRFPPQCRGSGESGGRTTTKEEEETQTFTRGWPHVGVASWSLTLSLTASPKLYNVQAMVGGPTHTHHTQQHSAELFQIFW